MLCPPKEKQITDSKGRSYCPTIKDKGTSCPSCGNPINPLVGNKYQIERDYAGEGAFPIVLERAYNSAGAGPGAVMAFHPANYQLQADTFNWTVFTPPSGWGYDQVGLPVPPPPITNASPINVTVDTSWRLSYDRTLTTQSGSALTATLYRPDSKTHTFTYANGVWVPDSGEHVTVLTQQVDGSGHLLGFTYVNEHDETEKYDTSGKLLSITNRAGLTQTLQYTVDPNLLLPILSSVTDAFGRQMTFTYDSSDRLTGATDPAGGKYTYAYDGHNNLASVTYSDGHTRQYLYENTTYPTAITGIIDENGNRFATWSYDVNGNAISSEHAVGIEKVTVAYPSATTSTVTDAGGATRTYTIQVINDMTKASSIVETCGTSCTRTKSMSYDANGNLSSSTDYNGNVTNYSYDMTRDLETSRTEAFGTPQARTITTQWHASYRLPLTVTEPGRVTSYTYDPAGNQLSKTITAGSNSRTWTYTYNTAGQILSATGPRNDVVDRTSYAYDSNGNLSSITNAANQVTTLANYDANGRVGLITDPNGATTALSYSPRGWLTAKVVTAGGIVQSTGYTYDYVGQLTKVTLPDGSYLNYTYDNAHRLTNIADSLGNSIAYTLDAMDNRVTETVKDPSSVLTRQISRVYDTINRLQQVTGAAQ